MSFHRICNILLPLVLWDTFYHPYSARKTDQQGWSLLPEVQGSKVAELELEPRSPNPSPHMLSCTMAPSTSSPETIWGFPGGSSGKESACNAGDSGSICGSGRSPGDRNGNPLQYSCLENPMNRWAWWATVHGVAKSQTWLSSKHWQRHYGDLQLHFLCESLFPALSGGISSSSC